MPVITERSVQRAHARILENLLVTSAFLESMAETLNAVKAAHLTPQQTEVQAQLHRVYDGESVTYHDYEASASAIQKMALNIWNPMMEGCTKDVAAFANTLFRVGWQIDHEPEEFETQGFQIPDVYQRLQSALTQVAEASVLEMTPFKRLIHEGELKAIGKAVDVAENLPSLQSRMVSRQDQSLAKLNIEFASIEALSAWLTGLSRKGLIPETPAPMLAALEDVEKFKHVRPDTRTQLTMAWMALNPDLDEKFVQATVNALLGSACSTKLDSLYQSASEIVSDIVRGVYEEREAQRRQQVMAENQATPEMKQLSETLEQLQIQLGRLSQTFPAGTTATRVSDLDAMVTQLTDRIDCALGVEEAPVNDSPAPN